MVINPFLFGVLTTLFVEMVILIITSLITSNKREKDETAKEVDQRTKGDLNSNALER